MIDLQWETWYTKIGKKRQTYVGLEKEKRMKKRLLASILALCVCMQTILPVYAAQSDTEEEIVSNIEEMQEELPEDEDTPQEDVSEEIEPVLEEETAVREPAAQQEKQKQYTSDQIQEIMESIPSIHVFTNVTTTLTDDLFGEESGFHWKKEADQKAVAIVASDTEPEQTYTAVYSREGYETIELPVEVSVSKISKVKLTADAVQSVQSSRLGVCQLEFDVTGAEISEDEYDEVFDINWETVKNFVSLQGDEQIRRSMTGISAGTDTIKATVTFKNVPQLKNGVTKFAVSTKVTVMDASMTDAFKITVSEGENTNIDNYETEYEEENLLSLSVDLEDLKELGNKTDMIDLDVEAYSEGEPVNLSAVGWSSSDASVASVKLVNKKPVLVLKKKGGVAKITITSKDKKKYSQSFQVRVLDHMPVLETTALKLNKYMLSGLDVSILPMNDNLIAGIDVYEYDKSSKEYEPSDRFVIEQINEDNENIWTLNFEEGADEEIQKKTVYQCQLVMDTDYGEIRQNIKITVDVTKPKASLKKVKNLNLFRLDGSDRGAYSIISKYEVSSVRWETSVQKADPYISASYQIDEGKIYLKAENVTKDNYSKLLNKKYSGRTGKLVISFVGYRETADFTLVLTPDVENKANVSLKADELVMCPAEGLVGRMMQVYDANVGKEIYFTEDDLFSVSGAEVERQENGRLELIYTGNSGATVTIKWKSPLYLLPVNIKVKISVIGKPQFSVPYKTVILNTLFKEETAVPVDVKGSEYPLDEGSFKWKMNKGLQQLYDTGAVGIRYDEDDQMLYLKIKDADQIVKSGVYQITLNGTVAEGIAVSRGILTVKIETKEPVLKVTAKGSIDLLNREQSCMILTPTLQNMSATIENVEVVGTYSDCFYAELDEFGKILLYAEEDATLRTKVKYPVKIRAILDNEEIIISNDLNITPMERLPKLLTSASKITLYRALPLEKNYRVSVAMGSNAKIEDICMVKVKNADYFQYVYEDNGTGILSLNPDAAIKAGNYTLSFMVYYEGRGISSKPATVRLTVTVK